MNGDDTGKLGGGCRGEMLRRTPACVWSQEDRILPGIAPPQGSMAPMVAGTQGLLSPFLVQHPSSCEES